MRERILKFWRVYDKLARLLDIHIPTDHAFGTCWCQRKKKPSKQERQQIPMFTVFKPKGGRIKAEKITVENVPELAMLFQGRLTTVNISMPGKDAPNDLDGQNKVTGFEYPTFDGIKKAKLDDYVVALETGGYDLVKGEDFELRYEPARVVTRTT